MKTLTWQKPGQQNVAQELIKIIINYVAELRYIYIDVWATWCGPCRGELPALKELEEKYAGKDIHFVSLSCDKNKKAWENMVTKDQLKGIQLHMGTDRTFMDAYLINGIPRFILLDRDGKIISANMTRPSDPKTAEKFNELLGL